MSKVNYVECDICGDKIYGGGLTTRIKGKRYFPLVSGYCKVDICNKCINKISELVNKEKEGKQ
jgi:hypothetical protein